MEVFELAEIALDEFALAIQFSIDGLAVALGWDVRLAAAVSNEVDNGLCVIAAIGNQGSGGRHPFEQNLDRRFVGGLAGWQDNAQRQTILIHKCIDLGAQPSTRTADGVIRTSFFPTSGVLVGANDRAVDQMQGLRRGRRQHFEDTQPHTGFRPPIVSIVDGCVWAVSIRKIPPWRTGAQNVENAVDHPSIVNARYTRTLLGSSGSMSRHSISLKSYRAIQNSLKER